MCRPKTEEYPIPAGQQTIRTSSWPRLWPVSPIVLAVLLPCFMSSGVFLNRGYTLWFHCNSLFFLLTQNEFLSNFLALQGLTVTLGWYASLTYDWYKHNRFGYILYWNMPQQMTQYMMNDNQEMVYDTKSMLVMLLAHALDTLGHPILAYYYWRRNWKQAGVDWKQNLLTWPVICSSYLLSRIWSLVHTIYNHGKPGLFYFGYDIYDLLDRDAWLPGFWLPAYITEGLVYLLIVAYKLRMRPAANNKPSKKGVSDGARRCLDKVPSLLSSSTISDEASISGKY
jgi:hypothetical protein